MGAGYLEQDLYQTLDGELVAVHDPTLDRTARGPEENCTGLVTTKTLARLRTCDFGVWFGPEFAGEGIHTIQEIFARYGTRARYYIETKTPFAELRPGTEETLLAAMDAYGLRQPARDRRQVIIQSFSPVSLAKIHALDPELPLIQLTPDNGIGLDPVSLETIRAYAIGIAPPLQHVTPDLVAQAHARCLDVHPWTVNTREEMRSVLAAGVDGMFTDYPDRLTAVLDEGDIRPPEHCRGGDLPRAVIA